MDYSNSLSPTMMYDIAKTQGEVFEYAYQQNYDMSIFIQKYMNSEFCNTEMDSECSYFHFKNAEMCLPYVIKESDCPKSEKNKDCDYNFIGMIYRYLVFLTEKPSKEIFKIISPEELDDLSISYENFEIEDAAKDILDNKREQKNNNLLATL